MKKMLESPMGRLRFIGMAEGLSLLVLLGIAMPLKYLADSPGVVAVVGPMHGFLYMVYLVAAVNLAFRARWTLSGVALGVVTNFSMRSASFRDSWTTAARRGCFTQC